MARLVPFLFVFLFAAEAAAMPSGGPCETDRVENFSEEFRSSVNPDLNDYGLLVIDAGRSECVDGARGRMLQKIRNTLVRSHHLDEKREVAGPYRGWLEGVHVALIFAAAMEIHGQGAMTTELDTELQRVRDSYQFRRDPDCGYSGDQWKGYNTCMDDLSVAASAYAWIAAYEHRRERDRQPYAGLAGQMILRSLDSIESVCLHLPHATNPSPNACNATHQDLMMRSAVLISLNHGQQSIPYGFGLMTSIAAAELGLLYAEAPYSMSLRERLVALALYDEARFKTGDKGDRFRKDCATNLRFENGLWLRDDVADCGELLGYRPRMYPLRHYYRERIESPAAGTISPQLPSSLFIFDEFDHSLFSPSPTSFQNAGRMVTYGDLAYRWWLTPPPMPEVGKPLDDHDPVGSFGFTGRHELTGWACDADAPSIPLRIDFYSSSDRSVGSEIGFTVAEHSQVQADASLCGGTALGFTVTLPRTLPLTRIYAFATDATGRGVSRLELSGSRLRPASR